jgi:hypothetical protein
LGGAALTRRAPSGALLPCADWGGISSKGGIDVSWFSDFRLGQGTHHGSRPSSPSHVIFRGDGTKAKDPLLSGITIPQKSDAKMTALLSHSLDLYLASIQQAPTCVSVGGSLVFEAEGRLQVYAAMLPDGRVELHAGAGYVRAELLQAIVEADEDDDVDEEELRQMAGIVARWTGEDADWTVDVHRQTGLLTLSMLVSAIPEDPAEWATVVDAFMRTAESWIARLQRDAPEPLLHSGVGLAQISSGAFLRC